MVEEGATDLGGLSANGDHISPEHPFPSVHRMRKQLAPRGYALTERLCVYPQYMDSDWLEQDSLVADGRTLKVAGRDKGKHGEVIKVIPKENRASPTASPSASSTTPHSTETSSAFGRT